MSSMKWKCSTLYLAICISVTGLQPVTTYEFQTCEIEYGDDENDCLSRDPALRPMKYNVGDENGVQIFMAYVTPEISSFYQEEPGTRKKQLPHHTGLAGKFLNLSPDRLYLFWNAGPKNPGLLIAVVEPFQSAGTGTFQGHEFYFTHIHDPDTVLIIFHVSMDRSLYVYDPYDPNTQNEPHLGASSSSPNNTNRKLPHAPLDSLSDENLSLYTGQKENIVFAKYYREFTGRDWLGFYKRPPPIYHMWPADYFDQIHRVTTKDTHFVIEPPPSHLGRIRESGSMRIIPDTEPRLLQAYRSSRQTQIFTLKAISCAPRVFEIDNFLSIVEVDHLLDLTKQLTLSRSTTSFGMEGEKSADTRTSSNTWIYRETSPIVDTIYRRIADVLGIDEPLLRFRDEMEYPDMGSSISIAEALQVVHYDPGQEYTSHHDFGFPILVPDNHQLPARFATILLYLNEGMEGGETSFPKYMNADTREPLTIVPKKGKVSNIVFPNIQDTDNTEPFHSPFFF